MLRCVSWVVSSFQPNKYRGKGKGKQRKEVSCLLLWAGKNRNTVGINENLPPLKELSRHTDALESAKANKAN